MKQKTIKQYAEAINGKVIKHKKLYTVWLKNGPNSVEATSDYLTWSEALTIKKQLKLKGHNTTIQLVLSDTVDIRTRGF